MMDPAHDEFQFCMLLVTSSAAGIQPYICPVLVLEGFYVLGAVVDLFKLYVVVSV